MRLIFVQSVFFMLAVIPSVLFAEGILNSDAPLQPIPRVPDFDKHKAALGERLFHDKRLSADNSISCAHCHSLDQGGVYGLKHSFGVQGREGSINTPTVFNSALNIAQFWDGRAGTLEDQVDGPVHAEKEMNSSWPEVTGKLLKDEGYQKQFKHLYSDGITSTNIKNAIAEFERSLTTPDSRFDQYLRGDHTALSEDEKDGYALFGEYGCVACHQGANIGGNMFQKLGTLDDYFMDRGHINQADYGRFNVTGREEDRFVFKVPSLRLVTLTAPYFHDGSVQKLEDAIRKMGKYQLGRNIPDEDIALIIKFLHTLAGKHNGKPLENSQ